ncbi:MAG: NADP-dependent oxidoreductase, partial [Alphaproteobacteria bacterium]
GGAGSRGFLYTAPPRGTTGPPPQREEGRMDPINRRVTLKARPAGRAGPEHFAVDTAPVRPPAEGEALVQTLLVSVDPAMRVWVSENPGYVEPVVPGEVMRAGGVGRVLESRSPAVRPGDLVQARLGWQSHVTLPGDVLQRLDPALGGPLDWIGPLGGTALTAYFGLLDVGAAKPGETVLVSAASGGVGQMAGQIARLTGCRTVGIAGGPDKCRFVREELGFDAAIDYKAAPDIAAAVRAACPEGVDVYFDNVGGPTLDAALASLKLRGRVAICGRISQTAAAEVYGLRNTGMLIGKRARMEGFLVFDYADRYDEARRWLSGHLKAGRLRQRLHVLDGLERAPEGLAMLFRGENTGKLVVRVADDGPGANDAGVADG